MKLQFKYNITSLLILFLFTGITTAQTHCDSLNYIVKGYINNIESEDMFISDGQVYKTFIHEDEVAEFKTIFYGGMTYRIAGSAGDDDNYLIFEIEDQDRNLLFSNEDYANANYWDFKVENTIDCYIKAKLDVNKKISGCTLIMIGFEKSY